MTRLKHGALSIAIEQVFDVHVRDNQRWTFNTEYRKHRPEQTFDRPLYKRYIKILTICAQHAILPWRERSEPNTFPLTLSR